MGKNSFRINLLSVWRELLVANRLMTVSPFRQTIIDVILDYQVFGDNLMRFFDAEVMPKL
uniref:Uncharacterized protein n=1 Tax=Candidatus Kentrum sp. FM TaxID=2126340 RepID=A0A450TBA8_9GAMM|nr:MAG: hypothetical protein BECKFM1743C_GA0114222_103588 [Candidatus Kentron sp. FM]